MQHKEQAGRDWPLDRGLEMQQDAAVTLKDLTISAGYAIISLW